MLTTQTLSALSDKNQEPEWLRVQRIAAFEVFQKLPVPVFHYGLGMFVDTQQFNIPVQLSKEMDAVFSAQTQDGNIEICSLADAMKKEFCSFQDLLAHIPADKFTAFHHAFFQDGTCIRIPPQHNATAPVFLTLDLCEGTRAEFVFVIAEPKSTVTIIDTARSQGAGYHSKVVFVLAKSHARVTYVTLQQHANTVIHIEKKHAVVQQHARMAWVDCYFGGQYTKTTGTTFLEEPEADVQQHALFFGDQNRHFDISATIVHKAPRTTSNLITRGALTGAAKTTYRGLVSIQPNAYKCAGYQKEDTLLLSDTAEINAVPTLEIQNNDVKCSHGATVSKVDPEKLYYIMSRGLSAEQATKIIVEGFFEPIIQACTLESVKAVMQKQIQERVVCL